jgi:hypothetical protein
MWCGLQRQTARIPVFLMRPCLVVCDEFDESAEHVAQQFVSTDVAANAAPRLSFAARIAEFVKDFSPLVPWEGSFTGNAS